MTYLNKNCFEAMLDMADNSIDLIVTDAPYGINYASWDLKATLQFTGFTTQYLKCCYRVLKPGGTMWLFGSHLHIHELFAAIEEAGFQNNLENWLIYARGKGRASTKHFKSLREDVFHLTKSESYVWNTTEYLRRVVAPYTDENSKPRGWAVDMETGERVRFTGCGNVQFVSAPTYHNKFEPAIHSCQKPVILLSELILTSSNVGDTIFDPFMGSGSTGIASLICERKFIGTEVDKNIYDRAVWWKNHLNESEIENYVKKRLSTSEDSSKFSFGARAILPK